MKRARHATINRHGFRQLEVDYGPVTVFHGRNGAGKTTMLHGPIWALRGKEPNIAVSATWEDLGTTHDALTVHRSTMPEAPQPLLVVHPRGAVSKVKAAEEFITAKLGRAWAWDAGEFLGLSDRKRTEELRAYLRLDIPLERARDAMLEAVPDLWDLVTDPVRQTDRTFPDSGQGYVAQVVTALQDAWRECNALKRTAGGPSPATLQDLPPGTVASWRERRDEIDLDLAALREKRGRLDGAADGRKMLEGALAAAKRDLERVERDQVGQSQRANAQRRLVERLNEEAKRAEIIIRNVSMELPNLEARKREVMAQADAMESRVRDAEAACAVSAAATELGMVKFLEAVIAEENETPEFPTRHIDEARRILAVLQAVGSVNPTELRGNLRGLKGQIEALVRTAAGHQASLATIGDPRKKVGDADSELARMVEREDQLGHEVTARKDEVQRLTGELERASGGVELSAIDTTIRALEEERLTVERNVDRLNDAVQAQLMHDRLSVQAEHAESRRARVRDAGTRIRTVETALLDEATSPLLAPATTLTQAVLGANLGLKLVDGASHVMLGDRPLAEHSESELAVGMLALQVAVQTQIGGWKVAVVDGLEVLDAARRFPFFRAVTDLVEAGKLDQFLGAHVGDPDPQFAALLPSAYQEARMEAECPVTT